MSLFCADDFRAFRTDRLLLAAQTHFPGVQLTDDYLKRKLLAAEKHIARTLKVFLEPTTVFPYTPTQEEIDALEGKPWAEEPGYDYDAAFFQGERWGYIVTRQRPVQSVEFIRFSYPDPRRAFATLPGEWVRLDKQPGHIRLIPASQTFIAPLGAFLLQALGGGSGIPNMIQVKYVAGLLDAKEEWPDLVDVIYKYAGLSIIQESFPAISGSISADGLSQSQSIDLEKYGDMIQMALFGPKGSNGGLWTAIHGIGLSVLGVAS